MTCMGMASLPRHGEGDQREHPRAPDGQRQRALVARAGAADPARHHLAAIGDEALEELRVLVVDRDRGLGAEAADLAAGRGAAATLATAAIVADVGVVEHFSLALDACHGGHSFSSGGTT